MLVVGLTGGIGSGKSTISNFLKSRGAFIIDADEIAREVVEPGEPAWQQIKEFFGETVLEENGTLNRAMLGQVVFQDPAKREVLNSIIHPAVIAKTKELISLVKNQPNSPLIVVDAPLLIEAKMTILVDEVWVIDITKENQIKRVMARDKLPREAIEKRIASQMPTQEKLKYAHRVIDSNGNEENTLHQVAEIWELVVEKGYDK